MIRAVTFDFWNTLYVEDPDALERRRERRVALAQGFFAAAGKPSESARIRQAMQVTVSKISALREQQHRCPDHAEVGGMIAAELGLKLNYEDATLLAESISSVGRDYPPAPVDGAGVVLSELRGKVALGMISDTGLTFGMHLQQAMEAHGLAEFFSHFTWSDLTLTTKPAARQFLYTLTMLEVDPAETVHVGDLEAADIAGAKEVGMRTIRICSLGAESAADATVRSLAQIPEVLAGWSAEGK